jgi:hypothetical protein
MTGAASPRTRWVANVATLLAAAALLAGLVALASRTIRAEEETPAPALETTPTPEATATPWPTPTPEPTPPLAGLDPKEPGYRVLPFGPIAADRAVVDTGDSDCLNVRRVPGTTFAEEPRFCVNNGQVLWLWGEPREVDNETWRYALGQGWVAVRYTRLEPVETPRPAVTPTGAVAWQQHGSTLTIARLDARGTALSSFKVPSNQGLGSVTPRISPDGRYVAVESWGPQDGAAVLTIADVKTGELFDHPDLSPIGWADASTLIIRKQTCDPECTTGLGLLVPGKEPALFDLEGDGWGWAAPVNGSVVATLDGRAFYRVARDGGGEPELLVTLPEESYFGPFNASPDGRRLLSGYTFGAVRLLDLRTYAYTEFKRAAQQELGGRCGGVFGQTAAWLDNGRIIYHEGYALQRWENGLTIGTLATGARRVLPFANVTEIVVINPSLVAFTTGDWLELEDGQLAISLTWLLDVPSGEARPIVTGTAAFEGIGE